MPVDLDRLQLTWVAAGEPEDIKAYLENIQTSSRTAPVVAPSSANNAVFASGSYRGLLVNRTRSEANQIRAVVQTKNASFQSGPVELHVGLTVIPFADSSGMLDVAAMIDNARIAYYGFEAKVVVPPKNSSGKYFGFGPHIAYQFKKVKVPRPHSLDWDGINAVYFGPYDPRIARFQFLIDNSLKEPEQSKWKEVK